MNRPNPDTVRRINRARRTTMTISIVSKVVVLLVLLPFASGSWRWILVAIFGVTILAQLTILLRQTR